MNMIEMLISIWLVSWFITRFEPLQMVLELLPNKLIPNLIKLLVTCLKCVSFWSTLLVTQNIVLASGMAFISFWYDKWIGPIERRVRL
jgi:hypothetical protein